MEREKRLARIAGVLYLGVAVLGGFAELVVRDRIVELGRPLATAENIRESATLFRAGFVADLAQATLFLFTAMALYLLLRGVNELVARAMVVIVAVSVAIICLNLLNQWVALQLATDRAFGAGSDALVGLFAGMHHDGYLIAQIFFGLWLLPLGYLVVKSGWFPTWIGVLLIAGCFGYLVDTFATFLAPGVADTIEAIVLAPAAIGELSFVAYLLIKGVRDREEEPRALAAVAS
ncbi:MAG TPA: DUF4386 domain-containing protein [Actinomycetota bacterium]|nr:DUF4386 domain-containing protein [Actinomycetota bacterium]